ncbi:glycosyltransferase family 2 protein [uncultured Clostridium sp.]|uniref:glycosyltransferase family 2 protein n=1 Tax=uncultured Clostridium sp. TaxID=59620 RepID=UPI002633D7CF|nr:glycosyltransferase family 2 protein [uncultured Clostridium sp.]
MKFDNQTKDLISIVMPVYNASEFIAESIDSIMIQTYKKWELILVDDCSVDESPEIIKKYTVDNRIKYIKLEKNSGAAVARNIGLATAKGRYIAFLDSDDIWNKEKLDKQLKFMKEKRVGFTFTEYSLMDESGQSLNKIMKVHDIIDYKYLLGNTIIGCSTVVIDREIIGDVKMPNIRSRQDGATWLKILREGNNAYGIAECLTKYRIVKNSVSRNKIKAAKKIWYVYREIEHLNLFVAMKYFMLYSYNAVVKRI